MIIWEFIKSKCSWIPWCKVIKRCKLWDTYFLCKKCQCNTVIGDDFISIPKKVMHLSYEQRAFLLKQEKDLQQKREDIWALIYEMYIGNIIDYLKDWKDDWRYELWIHTKICMMRPWKLSDEIPYEINALNYSNYSEIIEYVHFILFYNK